MVKCYIREPRHMACFSTHQPDRSILPTEATVLAPAVRTQGVSQGLDPLE